MGNIIKRNNNAGKLSLMCVSVISFTPPLPADRLLSFSTEPRNAGTGQSVDRQGQPLAASQELIVRPPGRMSAKVPSVWLLIGSTH